VLRVCCGAVRFPRVEPAGELFEHALPVAFAVRLLMQPGLDADLQDGERHLREHAEAIWVEFIGRPSEDVVHVVERHAEQVFELLCRRPSAPLARAVPAADRTQLRETDEVAILVADAELALSLGEPATVRYVAGTKDRGKRPRFRTHLGTG